MDERKPYIEELYFNNLWLMKKTVKPYLCFCEEDELLDEAFLGLCEAIEHYETNKGAFASYACYWYRQSVTRFLEKGGFVVRVPAHFRDKIRKYKRAVSELSNKLGHLPTDQEVSEFMGVDFEEIQDIKLHECNMVSLDAPLESSEDCEMTFSDTIADDFDLENSVVEEVYAEYEQSALWGVCERYMSASEYGIIEDYYKKNKTQVEIANELNLSHQRVRQIHQDALGKMRIGKAKKELKEQLEIAAASEYRTSFRSFTEHQESRVEYLALKRIELGTAI